MMKEKQTVEDMGFERMLTIKDVRDVLGVSYGVILGHIRNGYIRAYKATGEPVRREEVLDGCYGLRVKPSDLREYLNDVLVK
jgi:hypothetical protein